MSDMNLWPVLTLALLGVWHGLNPGMGWLFAVALGLQERKRRAVWRALPPLAVGHALAVGAAIAVAALLERAVPTQSLKWLVAAVLLSFGVYRLFRHTHPRFGGMRVGMRDLTLWSFLMATAHGAGLMVLPVVFGGGAHDAHGHGAHTQMLTAGLSRTQAAGVTAIVVHTVGYLLITALAAVVVYEKLGLRLLRRAWINLDVIWAAALIGTALLTPLL